jgi:hypothetical protein
MSRAVSGRVLSAAVGNQRRLGLVSGDALIFSTVAAEAETASEREADAHKTAFVG